MQDALWSMKGLTVLLAAALATGCTAMPAQHSKQSDPSQDFVMAATLACVTLSLKQDRSVKCLLNYENNKPVLQVSFAGSEKAKTYGPLVLSLVGPQLCAAVKADKNGAALALIETRSNQMSRYSCDERVFSGWVQATSTPKQ